MNSCPNTSVFSSAKQFRPTYFGHSATSFSKPEYPFRIILTIRNLLQYQHKKVIAKGKILLPFTAQAQQLQRSRGTVAFLMQIFRARCDVQSLPMEAEKAWVLPLGWPPASASPAPMQQVAQSSGTALLTTQGLGGPWGSPGETGSFGGVQTRQSVSLSLFSARTPTLKPSASQPGARGARKPWAGSGVVGPVALPAQNRTGCIFL